MGLRRTRVDHARPADRYDAVADASAALVIRSYSSSFGLASGLLAPQIRGDVRNIYALVRVADEIVDAPRPDQDAAQRRLALDHLEAQTLDAIGSGASTNLIVHAFARTARRTGIDGSLITPFFASMRADLDPQPHDTASLQTYIHGSAEVIGLMCLRVFVAELPEPETVYRELSEGARRLGAGFQKVNFLRDLGVDGTDLGRGYLVDLDPADPDEAVWRAWLDDVDADLAAAATIIPRLPADSRIAVCVAHDLFAELSARLRATPARVAARHRVRVSGPVKLRIAARVVFRGGMPVESVGGVGKR
ncbi:squalene/phytoene synthase family protein [Gordonia sp. NB41Y]|uniref:phytoene/squalene synthase family protein n=1 Tax=Gordonia sp. NB41Y TaxID=875808 RepID=UPI0006B1C25B|nr:squalene/phytoene synthase family protein [Gordonia sp. NB41Y]EMP12827.2 phytoene synthase [Gordonia sp. NB41Y]WLP88783.1 squalene/phytoene synthase family protein [Gordonia sp. NB41Y]